jgi:anti-anti-sigma regulatory factor
MIVESYEDVIILSGALRSNYWETLHTAISLTLRRHPSGVIIDCSGLTEVSEDGAQTFRDVMEYIRNQEARVIVASVPETVLDVLRLVPEVRSQLAIADSVEEARHSLDLLLQAKPGKRKASPQTSSKIAVLLTGEEVDRQALVLAAQIAEARDSEIHTIYIVLIPRDLPLTAPMPREEGIASMAIDRARSILDRQGRSVPHVERGRDLAATVENVLQSIKATMVVLPITATAHELDTYTKVMRTLVSRLTQEVIFVRPAKPNA